MYGSSRAYIIIIILFGFFFVRAWDERVIEQFRLKGDFHQTFVPFTSRKTRSDLITKFLIVVFLRTMYQPLTCGN